MEQVYAIVKTPITRGPVKAEFWWRYPNTWHPIIIIFIGVPRPVTGLPKITVDRTGWLYINRYCRRGKARLYTYAHAYLGIRFSER
jgi:hypothetical protein